MRIGFIIDGIAGGGAERRTVNIVNELVKYSLDIFLITNVRKENEYPLKDVVNRKEIMSGKFFYDILNIGKFCKEQSIDVIIGMGIYANLIVCCINLIFDIKSIVVEANDPKHDNLSNHTKIARRLLYWKSDGYVFQTEEEKSFYNAKIQKKGTVIHNPVIPDLPERCCKTNKEIVAAGRLVAQKNFVMLIKAFAIVQRKHPNYVLKIYGEGEDYEKLLSLSAELNLEKTVQIKDFSLRLHEEIKHADLFVLSSDYEGMPNSLLEAMAMGFPVISTDCDGGGPRAIIKDGTNGFLVEKGNFEMLADKIIFLIENKDLKEQLAQKARNVRSSHSISSIGEQWYRYIETIYQTI